MIYLIYIYKRPTKFNIFIFLFVILLIIIFCYEITKKKEDYISSRYQPIYSDLSNSDLNIPSNRLINIYSTKYGKNRPR